MNKEADSLTFEQALTELEGIVQKLEAGDVSLDEAIDAYKKALSIKPDYVDACCNLGVAFAKQNRLDEVIKAYDKVLLLQPNYAEVYNNMGVIFHNQIKLNEAIHAYQIAILLEPTNAAYWNNLAYSMLLIKDNKPFLENILSDLQKEKKLVAQDIDINILKYKIFRSENISDEFFDVLTKSLII